MVSQPRIEPRAQSTRTPIVAPALRPMQSLPRLLLVASATILVVLVWGLQEPGPASPAPVAADPAAAPAIPGASTVIAAPSGIVSDLAFTITSTLTDGIATIDSTRLHPNALPRPPELEDPIRPTRLNRYTVTFGDAIFNIARARGVSVDDILLYNPSLGDGTHIAPGDVIFIPVFGWDRP